MTVERRAKRKSEREARQLVWQKAFTAARANPNAGQEELFGIVAAEIQDAGDGFDIGLMLQILITVLPLILKLFGK
jgi:hypothetical protein